MANLNKLQLIGRLGKDPELRYTTSGTARCTFSLAVEAYRKEDQPKHTEWFNIIAWARQGEVLAEYLKKGSLVYIEGEVETREYEKDGQRRRWTEVKVRQFQFLDSKPREGAAPSPPAGTQAPDFDEEIPF